MYSFAKTVWCFLGSRPAGLWVNSLKDENEELFGVAGPNSNVYVLQGFPQNSKQFLDPAGVQEFKSILILSTQR